MKKLPTKYTEGVPRVSEIVENEFPFIGTAGEKHFHSWLNSKGISFEEYMKEASSGGTYIHSQLESYLKEEELNEDTEYSDFIINGIEGIEEWEMKPIELEFYLASDKVQGTCDFYGKVMGKDSIVDYKTYGLAKYKWNLQPNKYKKPTDKLKKARVQLSIYRRIMKKNVKLYVLEVDKEGYYMHELKYLGDKEVEKIINKYYEEKK